MKIKINTGLWCNYTHIKNEKGLIIFVHGLTSDMHEPIIADGSSFFNTHYYSTCTFNLYGDADDEKKLIDVSLSHHIEDINNVVQYFVNQGQQNITLIGHSFGGLSILYSDLTHIKQIVLRDASIGGDELLGDVSQDSLGHYIDRGDNYKWYINQSMYNDFCIPPEQHIQQLKKILIPVTIIAAEHGLQEPAKTYTHATGNEYFVIKGADHTFSDNTTKGELFITTLEHLI